MVTILSVVCIFLIIRNRLWDVYGYDKCSTFVMVLKLIGACIPLVHLFLIASEIEKL